MSKYRRIGWNKIISVATITVALLSIAMALVADMAGYSDASTVCYRCFVVALCANGFYYQARNLYYAVKRREYYWIINTIAIIALIFMFF